MELSELLVIAGVIQTHDATRSQLNTKICSPINRPIIEPSVIITLACKQLLIVIDINFVLKEENNNNNIKKENI